MPRKPAIPPAASSSLLLVAHFADLKDPRRDAHKVHYPLPLLLLIVFAAVLSGFTGWDAFEQFAESKREWLRALWPFDGDDTPSADTLRRVFERLDATAFATGFTGWARALGVQMRGAHVAFDGKSAQGARDPAAPTSPLHLLHAWCVDRKLLLGVAPVEGVAREPVAIEAMLAVLALRGAVVTIDAIGATRGVTDAVVERGADFVVQLKANRGPQHAELEAHFAPHVAGAAATPDAHVTRDAGHGRLDVRHAWAADAAACPVTTALLPETRSVLCVVRERVTAEGATRSVHYYVSSLPPDAPRLLGYVRGHWSVENDLHRTLDVVLHEDETQVHKGPGAINLAFVRRVAETVLRHDTLSTRSLPKKMQRAALDDEYRAHLLTLDLS